MKLPKFLLLPVLGWAQRLRYPTLFKITAVLFLLTLVVPDPIILLDEIVLGLGTLLLSRWKNQSKGDPAVDHLAARLYECNPDKP